jgi:hypothetical protein
MDMSQDLVAASATPLVLAILAEGDSYGYAIIKRVAELSGGHHDSIGASCQRRDRTPAASPFPTAIVRQPQVVVVIEIERTALTRVELSALFRVTNMGQSCAV